jgi:ABC-type dipeptide/oligopeptide/nickel transport system permease subunit
VPLSVLLLAALLAVLLSDGTPGRLTPELAWAPPAAGRVLGSGEGGVDLGLALAHAELRGAVLAALVSLLGFGIGVPLGCAAALYEGHFERVVVRVCDLLQAFPSFLLAVAVLSSVRAPSRLHIAIVFSVTAWIPFARMSLAETRVLRNAAFVEAARALGLGRAQVLRKHIVPNVLGLASVQLGATAAALVVSEAALSFVGFGTKDGLSLGSLLDQGVVSMLRAPHVLLAASVAVFVTSFSFMTAGRAFRPSS